MAQAIIWSNPAVDDLEQIVQYIARDSHTYVAAVAGRILDSIDRLADFPGMGRVVPEFEEDAIRELIVYPYRVIYRVGTDRIVIAAIIHGARDLLTATRDREM